MGDSSSGESYPSHDGDSEASPEVSTEELFARMYEILTGAGEAWLNNHEWFHAEAFENIMEGESMEDDVNAVLLPLEEEDGDDEDATEGRGGGYGDGGGSSGGWGADKRSKWFSLRRAEMAEVEAAADMVEVGELISAPSGSV